MTTRTATKKTTADIRANRQRVKNSCGAIVVAPLWPKKGENLGTLARTCDAVGACMAVPVGREPMRAVTKGNTIGTHNTCLHVIQEPETWLEKRRFEGWRIVGVELAHDAIPLSALEPLYVGRAVVVLGHEAHGIPESAWPFLDEVVEIPMRGVGNSLNVAVAGSLVLYKLAGLS